jgi:hypothetical protein
VITAAMPAAKAIWLTNTAQRTKLLQNILKVPQDPGPG